MEIVVLVIRVLLIGVFGLAAATKLLDLPGTTKGLEGFGIPKILAPKIAIILPILEFIASGSLAIDRFVVTGCLLAILLSLSFTLAMIYQLLQGRTPDCHCFGQLYSAPISNTSVIRTTSLLLVSIVLLLTLWLSPDLANTPIYGALDSFEQSVIVLFALNFGLFAIAGTVVLFLLRRYGEISVQLGNTSPHTLSVGQQVPNFLVEDRDSGMVEFREIVKRTDKTVILFISPGCPYCEELLEKSSSVLNSQGTELSRFEVLCSCDENIAIEVSTRFSVPRVLYQPQINLADEMGITAFPTAIAFDNTGTVADEPLVGSGPIIQKYFS